MSLIKKFVHDNEITNNQEFKQHLTRLNKFKSNDKNLDILINLLLINYLRSKQLNCILQNLNNFHYLLFLYL